MKATHPMSSSARTLLSRRAIALVASGIACAVAAVLAACASSGPVVHLYTLMPADLPARGAAASTGAATPLLLEIRLPSQVEQPQLLVRLPDDSLMSLEQERWASPLRDELRQALFEELGAKYGIVEVRSATVTVPVRVAIDVRRFDSIAGKEARIEGSWSLTTGSSVTAATRRCEWLYREPASGPVGALPDAHRRAVVRLADAVGNSIVQATTSAPVACPTSDLR